MPDQGFAPQKEVKTSMRTQEEMDAENFPAQEQSGPNAKINLVLEGLFEKLGCAHENINAAKTNGLSSTDPRYLTETARLNIIYEIIKMVIEIKSPEEMFIRTDISQSLPISGQE